MFSTLQWESILTLLGKHQSLWLHAKLCQNLTSRCKPVFSRLMIVCIGKNITFSASGFCTSFSEKNFDDEDSVDGNRPSSASSSSSKAPSSSRRNVSLGTTRRLMSSSLGSKSSGESTSSVLFWGPPLEYLLLCPCASPFLRAGFGRPASALLMQLRQQSWLEVPGTRHVLERPASQPRRKHSPEVKRRPWLALWTAVISSEVPVPCGLCVHPHTMHAVTHKHKLIHIG